MKRWILVPALALSAVVFAQTAASPPRTVGIVIPDGGIPTSIQIPDGGIPTTVQGTVNASIQGVVDVHVTLPDGGTQILDVQGRGGGPLLVSIDDTPTFSLSSNSLAAIAAPTCTVAANPPVITLTTTPVDVPTTPLAGRTQLIIKNLSNARNVWCCVGSGCTPTATAAYVILTNGDFQSFPVRDTLPVRCRAATATADINAQEASCV